MVLLKNTHHIQYVTKLMLHVTGDAVSIPSGASSLHHLVGLLSRPMQIVLS